MSSPRLTIRLDSKLHRELLELARSSGRSESDVMREALRRHVKQRRVKGSCYELARRAGIIGAAHGLPRDLSTNPAHFQGFGK